MKDQTTQQQQLPKHVITIELTDAQMAALTFLAHHDGHVCVRDMLLAGAAEHLSSAANDSERLKKFFGVQNDQS